MHPTVYVIGWKSQENIDAFAATVPAGVPAALVSNGPVPLKAPAGWDHICGHGPRFFTSGFNRCLLHFMAEVWPKDPEAYPFICNDDILLEPETLPALSAAMADGIGLAAPVQCAMGQRDLIICGGTEKAWPLGVHTDGHRMALPEGFQPARWVSFAAVAVLPLVVQECGLLDRNLRHWFSDSDYSIRARDAGYRVGYVPEAIVAHACHQATEGESAVQMTQLIRLDQACFNRKWGGQIEQEMS